MVASKRFPVKTLLLSGGLSVSLALLGCATNGLSPATRIQPISQGAATSAQQPAASSAQNSPKQTFRYDWSSDRIINKANSFRTASFVDSLKPNMDLPPVAREARDPETSGGLSNSFAKNLPGADALDYIPNTPAVIGTNSYFLTASKSSSNVFALGSNGQVLWDLSLHENGYFDGSSLATGEARGTDTLYGITDTGRLYAINADTGLVISFTEVTEDEFHNSSPFVVTDRDTDDDADVDTDDSSSAYRDYIFLTSDKGRIYRYSFNGSGFSQDFVEEPVNSSNTGRFSSSAVVTSNESNGEPKFIYAGSEEGKLYKLDASDGDEVGTALDLSAAVRSNGCQIMATMAIDSDQDLGIVPCGSYLFKVRLNDAVPTALALSAQSPLLELKQLITLKTTRVIGPNHNTRPQLSTTILRDPLPTETDIALEQTFGFKAGDFLRIESSENGNLYAEVEEISDEGEVKFKGEGLNPIPSPSPDPLLLGGEKIHLANWAVRPDLVDPDPEATPFPTPTPGPSGADEVSRFAVGKPENLQAGDYLRFPTLPGQPVVQICSNGNNNCELGTGSNYAGIERFVPEEDDEAAVFYITVPGTALQDAIENEMSDTRYVPFEKLTNQTLGLGTDSTLSFTLANIKDFKSGDNVRIVHPDGSDDGRYEYGVISSVNSSARTLTLTSPLMDAPDAGSRVEIIDSNNRAFGRVTSSLQYSNGNILSEPVLRGNGQQVYVQHGNTIFEMNYASDSSFRDSANYLILQSGRLEQSNTSLTALSRSRPLVLDTDKLLTVDTDPSGKTGIFMNRVHLPLRSTEDRLNDLFPILAPNSLGQLPNRAETRPVLLGGSSFALFGGGNGVAYKLHKDNAW